MSSILIVTDHTTHYSQESVYPIARCMAARAEVKRVAIVSRGVLENASFFCGSEPEFFGQTIDQDFCIETWDWHNGIRAQRVDEFDTAFLRIDRPFDKEIANNFKRAFAPCKHVLNDIDGVLSTRLKSFVAQFDRFIPPSKVCYTVNEVLDFVSEYGDVVLKPDDGYAAKGVVRIHNGQVDGFDFKASLQDYISQVLVSGIWPRVAVRFLGRIAKGDKRLLIANGQLVSCVLRIPKAGGWLVNYASGRVAVPSKPTGRELEIIDYVSAKMKGLGVFLYSIDTIEGDDGHRMISEINCLNAGLLSVQDGQNQISDATVIVDELLHVTT